VVSSTALSILFGKGDGTFQPAVTRGPGGYAVTVGDFNGDGKQDLAIINHLSSGAALILLAKGDVTFQSAVSYPVKDFLMRSRPPTSTATANSIWRWVVETILLFPVRSLFCSAKAMGPSSLRLAITTESTNSIQAEGNRRAREFRILSCTAPESWLL
jgi:hypothetical protein